MSYDEYTQNPLRIFAASLCHLLSGEKEGSLSRRDCNLMKIERMRQDLAACTVSSSSPIIPNITLIGFRPTPLGSRAADGIDVPRTQACIGGLSGPTGAYQGPRSRRQPPRPVYWGLGTLR